MQFIKPFLIKIVRWQLALTCKIIYHILEMKGMHYIAVNNYCMYFVVHDCVTTIVT